MGIVLIDLVQSQVNPQHNQLCTRRHLPDQLGRAQVSIRLRLQLLDVLVADAVAPLVRRHRLLVTGVERLDKIGELRLPDRFTSLSHCITHNSSVGS